MMFDSIWSIVEFLSRWKSIFSNPATALSTQFIWYSKSFVVILTIFRASLSGVDAISNFAHSQEATLRPLKFYDEIIASKLHFQVPLLILVLFLFIPHLKLLSSLKFWSPSKASRKVGINFLQTPIHVDILTSSYESRIFLMASRVANPFQRVFNFTVPRFIRGITICGIFSITKCVSEIINIATIPWSMGFRMDVVLAGMKILAHESESPCTSPSELLGDEVHCHWAIIIWKESFFFSWAVGLNNGFKILNKPRYKLVCYHSGFVVPFIAQAEKI